MADKQELVHLAIREENGQIGYMSKGISIPEFYKLIQPQEQKIDILIDFYPIIDTLYSLHTQKQNDEINIKFNSLYNYWSDGKTYRKEDIILSRSQQLTQLSNEFLNILKIKLETFDKYDSENYINKYNLSTYDKSKKIEELINYSDMYIETILCFIHSKASLEIESFQQDKVLSDYVEYLKQIIIKLYLNTISNHQNNNPYNSSFLQYLALKKSNELENFLKLHGKDYSISDFKIYLFEQLEIDSHYNYNIDSHYNYNNDINRYVTSLEYQYYDDNEINIAILLRDTLFKVISTEKLLKKLKEGNVEWSSDSNDIKELEDFLQKGKE